MRLAETANSFYLISCALKLWHISNKTQVMSLRIFKSCWKCTMRTVACTYLEFYLQDRLL